MAHSMIIETANLDQSYAESVCAILLHSSEWTKILALHSTITSLRQLAEKIDGRWRLLTPKLHRFHRLCDEDECLSLQTELVAISSLLDEWLSDCIACNKSCQIIASLLENNQVTRKLRVETGLDVGKGKC